MVKLWMSASSTTSKSAINLRCVVMTVSCSPVTCWSFENVTRDLPLSLEVPVWGSEPVKAGPGSAKRSVKLVVEWLTLGYIMVCMIWSTVMVLN